MFLLFSLCSILYCESVLYGVLHCESILYVLEVRIPLVDFLPVLYY